MSVLGFLFTTTSDAKESTDRVDRALALVLSQINSGQGSSGKDLSKDQPQLWSRYLALVNRYKALVEWSPSATNPDQIKERADAIYRDAYQLGQEIEPVLGVKSGIEAPEASLTAVVVGTIVALALIAGGAYVLHGKYAGGK